MLSLFRRDSNFLMLMFVSIITIPPPLLDGVMVMSLFVDKFFTVRLYLLGSVDSSVSVGVAYTETFSNSVLLNLDNAGTVSSFFSPVSNFRPKIKASFFLTETVNLKVLHIRFGLLISFNLLSVQKS